MSDKECKCTNSCSGDSVGLVLFFVLFWNFGDNKYDLFDLLYKSLLKYLEL